MSLVLFIQGLEAVAKLRSAGAACTPRREARVLIDHSRGRRLFGKIGCDYSTKKPILVEDSDFARIARAIADEDAFPTDAATNGER